MDWLPQSRWFPLLVAFAGMALSPVSLRAEEKSLRQLIDAEVRSAWQREKIVPASRADDAVFLRRIYLDLLGTIPSLDETRQFLGNTEPDKREKLIDKLLADARFAVQQANVWDLVLFGRDSPNLEGT